MTEIDQQSLAYVLTEAYAKWSNEQDIDIRIAAARSEEAMLQLVAVVAMSFAEAIAPREKVASVARRLTDVFIAKLNTIDWDSTAKQLMTDGLKAEQTEE